MVDLNTCDNGEKLISKHGIELTYVKKLPDEHYYDHEVMYPDGSFGTRIDSGFVYKNEDMLLTEDHDIVEIMKKGGC